MIDFKKFFSFFFLDIIINEYNEIKIFINKKKQISIKLI